MDNSSNNASSMRHSGLLSHFDGGMGIERQRHNELGVMGEASASSSVSGHDGQSRWADRKCRKGKGGKLRT